MARQSPDLYGDMVEVCDSDPGCFAAKMNQPEIIVTGASSQIGVFVIPRLLARGFKVTAVSRRGKPERFPDFDQVSWLPPDTALQQSGKCTHLLSCGPMALAKQFMSAVPSLQSIVVFSSSSIDTKQDSPDLKEKKLILELSKLEADLKSMLSDSTQTMVILRPTLIYGCGVDANISRLAALIRKFGVMPLNGAATGLRQPVHADDLARTAVNALLSTSSPSKVMVLTGNSTLTYSDMVSQIFKALDKPVRKISLFEWQYKLIVRALKLTGAFKDLNVAMISRQNVDLVFDDSEARRHLDHQPRNFNLLMSDLRYPETSYLTTLAKE